MLWLPQRLACAAAPLAQGRFSEEGSDWVPSLTLFYSQEPLPIQVYVNSLFDSCQPSQQ